MYSVEAGPLMPMCSPHTLARAHANPQLPYAAVASLYLRPNLYNRCHVSETTNQTVLNFPGLSSAPQL